MNPKSGSKINTVDPTAPTRAEDADEADPGEAAETKARQREIEQGKYGSQKVKKYVPPEEEDAELTWIEIALQDRNGDPVPSKRFRIITPDEQQIWGTLNKDGFARIENIKEGTCKITFPELDQEAWEKA